MVATCSVSKHNVNRVRKDGRYSDGLWVNRHVTHVGCCTVLELVCMTSVFQHDPCFLLDRGVNVLTTTEEELTTQPFACQYSADRLEIVRRILAVDVALKDAREQTINANEPHCIALQFVVT